MNKRKHISTNPSKIYHRVTEHCQGLIHDMFFKEKSIEQIQKEYGYSTKHNAQNQTQMRWADKKGKRTRRKKNKFIQFLTLNIKYLKINSKKSKLGWFFCLWYKDIDC